MPSPASEDARATASGVSTMIPTPTRPRAAVRTRSTSASRRTIGTSTSSAPRSIARSTSSSVPGPTSLIRHTTGHGLTSRTAVSAATWAVGGPAVEPGGTLVGPFPVDGHGRRVRLRRRRGKPAQQRDVAGHQHGLDAHGRLPTRTSDVPVGGTGTGQVTIAASARLTQPSTVLSGPGGCSSWCSEAVGFGTGTTGGVPAHARRPPAAG